MSSSAPKLTLDAVYYHVTDMEKSIAFYRDTLGFRLTSRDYVARFDIDGVLFELVPNAPGNVLPGTGNARLSLGVTDIQNKPLGYCKAGAWPQPRSRRNREDCSRISGIQTATKSAFGRTVNPLQSR